MGTCIGALDVAEEVTCTIERHIMKLIQFAVYLILLLFEFASAFLATSPSELVRARAQK